MIVIPVGQSLTITNDGGTALFDFSGDASIFVSGNDFSFDDEGTLTISDTFLLPSKQEHSFR